MEEEVGQNALVPMLVDGDRLVAFCTFAPLDDIQPTEMTPWIGFVYTFPEYRGHRYAGRLLDYAEGIATIMGKEYVYISTGHTGLYEKYGYTFYKMEKDIGVEDSRVYRKDNDGAHACKAQAMFIKKYGKEQFFRVHDKLHQIYDFKKTQEILGENAKKGLRILEQMLEK